MAKTTKNSLTYSELKDRLQKELLDPVFILHGDDEYLIEQSINEIKQSVEQKNPDAD